MRLDDEQQDIVPLEDSVHYLHAFQSQKLPDSLATGHRLLPAFYALRGFSSRAEYGGTYDLSISSLKTRCRIRIEPFFIYGGVIVPLDRLTDLHLAVENIRISYGMIGTDQLKFNTHARPTSMTQADYTKVKSEVLDAAYQNDVKFIAYCLHHQIARKQKDKKIPFAANTVLGSFGMFLARDGDYGIVLMDRTNDKQFTYLKEKFQKGLISTHNTRVIRNAMHVFGVASDGTSHVASVSDIVLGTFRFCVNDRTNSLCTTMFPQVARMIWGVPTPEGALRVKDYGFIFRPQEIKSDAYEQDYKNLLSDLKSILKAANYPVGKKAASPLPKKKILPPIS